MIKEHICMDLINFHQCQDWNIFKLNKLWNYRILQLFLYKTNKLLIIFGIVLLTILKKLHKIICINKNIANYKMLKLLLNYLIWKYYSYQQQLMILFTVPNILSSITHVSKFYLISYGKILSAESILLFITIL